MNKGKKVKEKEKEEKVNEEKRGKLIKKVIPQYYCLCK